MSDTGDATSGDTSTSITITHRWEPTSIKIYNPILLRIDNYMIWRLEVQIHLDNIDVWELVSGAEVKPTTNIHDNWKRKNRQALSLLIQMVSDEYKGLIGNNTSSASAWKILEDTLDRKSVTSTIYPVNQVFDMKKSDAKSWSEHIAEFESRWTSVNSKVCYYHQQTLDPRSTARLLRHRVQSTPSPSHTSTEHGQYSGQPSC